MPGPISGAFQDFGTAASDLASSVGDFAEADAYGKAVNYAEENEKIVTASTAIQETQAQRQIYMAVGQNQAAAGANNLTVGGSAQALLRSSAQQGELQKQLIGEQGLITETGYAEQASAYQGMQQAAEAAGAGAVAGAAANTAAGIFSIFKL